MAMKASDSVGTQMPSAVKANLLDDGVVDTLVSVGASDVRTSVSVNASGQRANLPAWHIAVRMSTYAEHAISRETRVNPGIGVSPLPGRRANGGCSRPCPDRSGRKGRARRSRWVA